MKQVWKDILIIAGGVSTVLLLFHVKVGKKPKAHQLPPATANADKLAKKKNAVKALKAIKAAVANGEPVRRLEELNGMIAQQYGLRVKSLPGGQWAVLDDVTGEQVTIDKS